jgi:MSHA biogenesis protein MshK
MNWIGLLYAKRAAPLALACATWGALAQALSDPMRPPQPPASAAPAAPSAESPDAPPVSQLNAVLISGGRKLAVINGTAVPLGGRVGEAKVVRITETEVTVRRGDALETLRLHPAVEKHAVGRKPPAARAPSKPVEAGRAKQ